MATFWGLFALTVYVSASADEDHISMLQSRQIQGSASDPLRPVKEAGKLVEPMQGAGDRVECAGKTPAGGTKWSQLNPDQICTDIDTSSCEFTGEPVYFSSIGGIKNHEHSFGSAVVVASQQKSFKVCTGYKAITPKLANQWQWHITWFGAGTASKSPGTYACHMRAPMWMGLTESRTGWPKDPMPKSLIHGDWKPVNGDHEQTYVDVDTRACGFTDTPIYIVRVDTANEWATYTTGGESVTMPTATGFRTFFIQKALNLIKPFNTYRHYKPWGHHLGEVNHRKLNGVTFTAVGKVDHEEKRKEPLVGIFTYGAASLFKSHGHETGTWKRFEPLIRHPVRKPFLCMMSLNSPKPVWWNWTNSGQVRHESKARATHYGACKYSMDNPKWSVKFWPGYMKEEEFSKVIDTTKMNVMVFSAVGHGLPTPPPTPPTPMPPTPPPTPTPPTPEPTTPTAAPTAAATKEEVKKKCCCDK